MVAKPLKYEGCNPDTFDLLTFVHSYLKIETEKSMMGNRNNMVILYNYNLGELGVSRNQEFWVVRCNSGIVMGAFVC